MKKTAGLTADFYKRAFGAYCVEQGLPQPEEEVRVVADRQWRFDYYMEWEGKKVAVECEGGIWTGGRHTRGVGYASDMDKYMAAAGLGVYVLRVQPADLLSVKLITTIKAILYGGHPHEWKLPKKERKVSKKKEA
jgi:hypothetical protein